MTAPVARRRAYEQVPLPAPTAGAEKDPRASAAQERAKVAIARRAKPSPLPGYVRLVLTLELRREIAEKLSAQGVREGRDLEGVVVDLLTAQAK